MIYRHDEGSIPAFPVRASESNSWMAALTLGYLQKWRWPGLRPIALGVGAAGHGLAIQRW